MSSEVVLQQVPDRGTHNNEGPTAKCGEPVSWYDELQTTDGKGDEVRDRHAAVDEVFRSRVLQTPVHQQAELVCHSIWNIKPYVPVYSQAFTGYCAYTTHKGMARLSWPWWLITYIHVPWWFILLQVVTQPKPSIWFFIYLLCFVLLIIHIWLFFYNTLMARNGLLCADVPLRNYSLTTSTHSGTNWARCWATRLIETIALPSKPNDSAYAG